MTTYNRFGMAKNKIEKTNAARLLDRAGIAYELIPYTVDETNLAAVHVAEELGEDIATVFKTLVLCGDKTGYLVCVVPGDHEVDLKAAAKVSGNKRVEMLHMKELLPVTGYIRGGCSPIGMKRGSARVADPRRSARSGSIHGRRGRRHKPSDGGVAARVEPQAQSPFGRQKE